MAVILLAVLFAAPRLFATRYQSGGSASAEDAVVSTVPSPKPRVVHVQTPRQVKAIYMTQCVVGTPSFRDSLVSLIEETELNSVVIDIKDYTGSIAFPSENPLLKDTTLLHCGARDMREFIGRLHEKGIYVIGRITVFQDPLYTKLHPELAVKKASATSTVWQDYKGLSFIDVSAKPYWDYIIAISTEAHGLGFDELNYDYVRFPSDGNMKDISYPYSGARVKAEALESFFAHLYGELKEAGAVLSADLFGYTTTNTDDLGIGQLLERALPYFDYVMPMVYPSHYNSGFIGIEKPATRPYEVVEYSMGEAVRRATELASAKNTTSTTTDMLYLRTQANKGHGTISPSQLRPWLQDFDLGAVYTPEMVRTQIQATYDVGLTSWALWDAGNTYTREALLSE